MSTKNILKSLWLVALVIVFGFGVQIRVQALDLPAEVVDVGAPVYLDNVNPNHYFAVFLPKDYPANGDPCAAMSGEELIVDNNLQHYGTCFVNDPGVFSILELKEPLHSSYSDAKNSDYFVAEKTVEVVPILTILEQ